MAKRRKLDDDEEEAGVNVLLRVPFEVMTQEIASHLPLRERSYLFRLLCKGLAAKYDRLDAISTYKTPITVYREPPRDRSSVMVHPALADYVRRRAGTGRLSVRVSRKRSQRIRLPVPYVPLGNPEVRLHLLAIEMTCEPDDLWFMSEVMTHLASTATILQIRPNITSEDGCYPPADLGAAFPRLHTIRIRRGILPHDGDDAYSRRVNAFLELLFKVLPGHRVERWDRA